MITLKFLEFLSLSHRILGKINNVVYSLEISALILEIVNSEKCVKYANERTDDFSQHNITSII